MIRIDKWHDGETVTGVDVYHNATTGKFWGWLYNANGQKIGDYTADNSKEIETRFKGLFSWIG